jgi:pyruvate dehydrogenase E2 component (dihydrolipoamide acetyltransferase)
MALHSVVLPKTGVFLEDVLLTEWHKPEGAAVAKGDPLLTFETDKVTTEVESDHDGWLHRLAPEGAKLPIGTEVGLVVTTREEYEARATGTAPTAPPHAGEQEPQTDPQWIADDPSLSQHPFLSYIDQGGPTAPGLAPTPTPPAQAGAASPRTVRAAQQGQLLSPRARQLAKELELSPDALARITPTRSDGRITDKDIQAFLERREPATPDTSVRSRIPLRGRRESIARRTHRSLANTAQLTSVLEADVSTIVDWRARAKTERRSAPSYTAIFAQLVARTLKHHPILNSRLEQDEILLLAEIDLGIAVDTDAGLIVPVLNRADELTLTELHEQLTELADRARKNALTREELEGGTFTLSNSGIYPVDITTGILNYPQTGLLWIGHIRDRVLARDGLPVVRPTVQLCLTFDHRVLDGAPAAAFLADLVQAAEAFIANDTAEEMSSR